MGEQLFDFKAVFENIQVGLHIYQLEDLKDDSTLRMISANQAAEDYTGISVKNVVGKTLDENFPGLREKGIPQIYADVVRSGKSITLEDVYYNDNRVIESAFSVKAFPLPNNCVGVLFDNITDKQKAKNELKKSKNQLQFLFDNMLNGFAYYKIITNEAEKPIDYIFIEVNKAFEQLTGLSRNKIIGKKVTEIHPGIENMDFDWIGKYGKVALTGEPIKFEQYFEPQGHWYVISAYCPQRGYFALTFEDIAERKRSEIAEEALRENERLLRKIAENYPNAYVSIIEKDYTVGFTSGQEFKKQGVDPNQFVGLSLEQIFSEQADIIRAYYEKTFKGGESAFELFINNQHQYYRTTPLYADDGSIPRILVVVENITERKHLESRLQQAQKMDAIGTLAGGIAHDFNNMLGVITGNISYALSSLNKDDELYDVLYDVQASSKQAQSLTHQLLTFSKGGAPIKKVSNINRLIREAAIFSSRGAKANCRFELSDDLWSTEVDEGQINQVMSNLVINANQAMPNGGIITIRTENTNVDTESDLSLSAGKYIKIVIEDQGTGISKKYLPNIFDPYFSTKQTGSGLGLASTYSIIQRHSGLITVYSEVEKGTVFNIYLPASSKSMGTEHKENPTPTGQGKILIMDDQEAILKMASRMLSRIGYETALALDGIQAIEKYSEAYHSQTPFDCVILDLTVPGGMGGAQTITKLLTIDPKVKAIVSSGYSNDPIMSNYQDYGFCGVVPKPYTRNQLAGVLSKILSEKG
ncbi:MAG: PAS domain-containing protein [Candidatus Magnetomorum sp.]|nr:PAS domain-containing protein [Candidatus Magnetomorum sp.]